MTPSPSKKPFSWQLLLSAAACACGGVGLILGLWAVFGHGGAAQHGDANQAGTTPSASHAEVQPRAVAPTATASTGPASAGTAGALAVAAGSTAGNSTPTGSPAEVAAWKAVAAKYPALAIYGVNEVATSGEPVFVVAASGQVLITDAHADWVVDGGRLYVGSGTQVRDATHELALDAGARTYNALPRADALVNVYGKGTRQMIMFADPDCPACKAFERSLEAAGAALDVTVYTFPLPLVAVHPDAVAKMAWIECAKDPSAYWRSWMTDPSEDWTKWKASHPSRDDCDAGAQRIIDSVKAAKMLGFTQTPTLIFPNGQVVPGAIDVDTLNRLLAVPARRPGVGSAGLAAGSARAAATSAPPSS